MPGALARAENDLAEFARIAGQLDDPRLLRELERRALGHASAPEPPPASPERAPGFRARSLIFPILVLLVLAWIGLSEFPIEDGPNQATPADTVAHEWTGHRS